MQACPCWSPPRARTVLKRRRTRRTKRASWRLSRTALAAAWFRRRFPREMGQSWSLIQPKLQLKRRNSRIRWMRPSVLCFAPGPCRLDRTAMEAKALGKVEQRSKAGSLRFFRLFDSLGIQRQKLVLFPLRDNVVAKASVNHAVILRCEHAVRHRLVQIYFSHVRAS